MRNQKTKNRMNNRPVLFYQKYSNRLEYFYIIFLSLIANLDI